MASNGFIELLRLTERGEKRKKGEGLSNAGQWLGVAFALGEYRLVAPLGEIAEVLSTPDITPVPLAKPWLSGIANVRGRLLPVTHLSHFLGLPATGSRLLTQKVLVIDKPNLFSGLQVDQVIGIQSFSPRQYESVSLPSESPLEPYTHGRFRQANTEQDWYIFMPSLLAEDSRYLEAAI